MVTRPEGLQTDWTRRIRFPADLYHAAERRAASQWQDVVGPCRAMRHREYADVRRDTTVYTQPPMGIAGTRRRPLAALAFSIA